MKESSLGERSKVEISFLITCVVAIVWLLSHILPTEAMVTEHELKIKTLDSKMDKVLDDTSYIRAKVEAMENK